MKSNLRLVVLLLCSGCAGIQAAELELIQVPKTTVLAVATSGNGRVTYAEAFGKLVGFYTQPNHTFKVVFPQMSLSLNGGSYAAISITGIPQVEPGIEVLNLPSCSFAHEKYVGNYTGLTPAVEALVAAGVSQGLTVDRGCGIRVLHFNSPDDTSTDKLAHEIYVPFTRVP